MQTGEVKIGVDLGGTKIEAIVLDHDGRECWRERVATPQNDYAKTVSEIASLVRHAKDFAGTKPDHPVGIGTPGAVTLVNQQAVMKNCNSTVLNGRQLPFDLEQALQCKVAMANDANCFALAETHAGAALNYFRETPKLVFGVILGTGVGGGVVINGQVLSGPHSIAGEWGHNSLPAAMLDALPDSEKNRACYCGRKDCVETYLSGPGLASSYFLSSGETLSSRELVKRMCEQEKGAMRIWEQYVKQLGAALAQVINILDPDLIVLGGGMSQVEELYSELPAHVSPHVFSDNFHTPIVQAKLGDSAGVYGAAWLV